MELCGTSGVKLLRLAVAALAAGVTVGCGRAAPRVAAPPPAPPPPPEVSEVDLRSYRPNEAGAVMVIMYHHISAKKPNTDMNRTPEQFRKDLQDLYDRGYRPVTMREFAENKMDLPAGKSPVVLTFDDSYLTQFRYLDPGGLELDPDCAVGIMESFAQAHPDWKARATFFVLEGAANPPAFYQRGLTAQKFAYLIENGYEIGCHSLTHANFRRLSADAIQRQIGGAIRAIHEQAPNAEVTSLAIPYGNAPRDAKGKAACVAGAADGQDYRMSAVVMAAWRPTMATIGKVSAKPVFQGEMAAGDPKHIERILPDPRKAKQAGTLEYYLKYFDENPGMRYVSDGNPRVAAVPQGVASMVDEAKVTALGRRLQTYTLSARTIREPGAAAPSSGGR